MLLLRQNCCPNYQFANFFKLSGKFFLIIGERLSGWAEIVNVKPNSENLGSEGLCKAFRQDFQTFGVPNEITSDGGPEFIALETEFYKKWVGHHHLLSSCFPQGNRREEVAVKNHNTLNGRKHAI